jgi:Fusaric acid resistance protein family
MPMREQEIESAAPGAGLTWDWADAALGAACALPGALVALEDVPRGLALAFGALPAATVGLAPTRRGRVAGLALGVLTGVSILLGAAVGRAPAVAVATLLLLGVLSAWWAGRSRLGMVVMTLCLPMTGIGLSYAIGKAAEAAGLIALASVFALLVSMLWPERGTRERATTPQSQPVAPTLGYGLRLGLAGATAAGLGFALDLEHVGWACAAALIVMRPAPEMQRVRSVGRLVAVTVGAAAAIVLTQLTPPNVWYGIAGLLAVAGAAGTHRSRWYVTAGFTTFLVFLLLLYSQPHTAASRFTERVVETSIGVGLAYVFGLLFPLLGRRRTHRG